MFMYKKFFVLSFVALFAVSCSQKSDFPELRAAGESDATSENDLIVPEEMKPEVRYESNLDGSNEIAYDDNEEDLVIIASAASKEDEPVKIKPVLKDTSLKNQPLDREAITPRGVVKVHSKYENGVEVASENSYDNAVAPLIPEPDYDEEVVVAEEVTTVTPVAQTEEFNSQPSVTYQLETFLFDNGSAAIKAEDRKKIKEIVKIAKEKKAMIYVLGYSSSRTRDMDYVSHKMANFKISLKRAENVADALVKAGLKEKQVMLEALSDGRPAYLEVMPEGERLNRRVEVYIGY